MIRKLLKRNKEKGSKINLVSNFAEFFFETDVFVTFVIDLHACHDNIELIHFLGLFAGEFPAVLHVPQKKIKNFLNLF